MYIVKIMNEFLHGPIWVYNPNGLVVRKFPIINDDPILTELNRKAEELYSGYFEFDSDSEPCKFDYIKEKDTKQEMLNIISSIVLRLSEINDGSFTVEDYETERLNSL